MDLNGILNLRTRPATHLDLPKLDALVAKSMRVLAGRDYSVEQVESAIAHLMGVDTRLIDDGTYLVAEVDGEIVAGGGWSKRQALYGRNDSTAAPEPYLLRPGVDAARLRALFVHPNWARRGLGRLLVHMVEYSARDYGFRSMELVATRTGVPLYEASGYRAIKQVDIKLPGGVHFPGTQMRKSLVRGLATQSLAYARQTATGSFQRLY